MKLNIKPAYYSIALLLLLWQVMAMWVNHPSLFPSVAQLLHELAVMLCSAGFYTSLSLTILRGIIGFFIALIASALLATLAFHKAFWKSFLQPIIVLSRSIPVISLVLIALLLMSPRGLPIFIAFFTMFPILYQNILNGLGHVDKKLVEMAKLFNKSNLQRFRYIYFPASRDYLFAGIATAMGFGWRSVIIGEVLAVPIHGIGSGMKKAQAFIEMKELLAWTVVAIVVSFVFDWLVKIISQKGKNRRYLQTHQTKNIKHKEQIYNPDNKEITISNLNLSFKERTLFSDFNIQFDKKKIHLLKSASGTGKTTLLKLISGIIKADGGSITMQPQKAVLSYAFQDLRLTPWMNVEENIAFSLAGFPHISKKEKERLQELVRTLELETHSSQYPHELSGGEQQRVNLIRALMVHADILLLDEVLTGLDQALKVKSIQLIEEVAQENQAVVLWATHENIQPQLSLPYKLIDIP